MKFEKAHDYVLEEASIDLIYESIFANEIFQDLIDYVAYSMEHFPFYVKLTYEKLDELIKVKWKLKKHLKKDRFVLVCLSDEIDKVEAVLKLSENDKLEISNRLKNDEGTFISDLEDKNSSLIVVNENIEYSELKKALFHEMIHFLQWNTGRMVHDILNETGLDISDEDIEEMKNVLHIRDEDAKSLISYYFDSSEREAYYKDIFSECYRILHMTDKSQRKTFKWFVQMFKNTEYDTFEDYFANVVKNLAQFSLDISVFTSREMKLMLIYGYFKIGFTSLLNHLLGYFDKYDYSL